MKTVFREKAKTPAVPLLPLSTHVCTYATPPTHKESGPVRCLCLKWQIFANQIHPQWFLQAYVKDVKFNQVEKTPKQFSQICNSDNINWKTL